MTFFSPRPHSRLISGKASRQVRAFTLLELVVAMGMVSVLAISLYASVRIAFKAQQSAEANVEPSRTAELAMDMLRTDFQNAISPNPTTSTTIRVLAGPFTGVQGTDDRGHPNDDIIFCTTAEGQQHPNPNGGPDPTGDGDLRQVELTIITPYGSTDHVLMRRVTNNLLTDTQIDPEDEVICRGISSFSVRYYNGSDWSTTWDSRDQDNTLPTAVEVTLELEREGGIVNDRGIPVLRYVRIFALPCSTAAQDPNLSNFGGL